LNKVRPTTIAIHALGGQGGGVLADWVVETAERAGYIAQNTFIAGVAQRTGATVYYIEIFPKHIAEKATQNPVMALMPVAGDVDIVIASELMEAGRSISRGFVTPDKTTLITSSHRVYAIDEKMAMADGRKKSAPVFDVAMASAKHFISFDMEELAKENGTIISAVMFGALAGSGALPISREVFEDVITHAGRAVKANLAGFAAGFSVAQNALPELSDADAPEQKIRQPSKTVRPLLQKLSEQFPVETHTLLREGLRRVVDFQDIKYGDKYLERMTYIVALDKALNGSEYGWKLTNDTARYLALSMSFEDTIRVADLKTRASRSLRVRDEVKAHLKQIIQTTEFLHPRIEEICDILPNAMGRFIMQHVGLKSFLGRFFKKGRFVTTDSFGGFLLLYTIASLRPIRRISYRYTIENERIETWLNRAVEAAKVEYELGCEIVASQRLVKGYGSTHARGVRNFQTILSTYEKIYKRPDAASVLRRLIEVALSDEEGKKLSKALAAIETT